MKKNIKILTIIITTVLITSIPWYLRCGGLNLKYKNNNKIKKQIFAIENFLTRATKSKQACDGSNSSVRAAFKEDEWQEDLMKCASSVYIAEEIRVFVAEPELSQVKANLLKVADSIGNFTNLAIGENKEWAKESDFVAKQVLESITKTREEILRTKRKYHIKI